MSDPKRLAEGGGDSAKLTQLTRAGQRDLPNKSELAKVGAALAPLMGGAALGVGAAASSSGAQTGAAMTTTATAVSGGKVVAGVVAACAIAAGSIYGIVKSSEPMQLESAQPLVTQMPAAPPAPEPTPVVVPQRSAEPQAKPEPSGPPKSAPAPATSPPDPSELSLLSSARRVVKSDPEKALALTQQHRRLYPNGTLVQEREVIAIEALRRMGQSESAGQRADEFKKRYPGSAHAPKVDEVTAKP